MGKILIVDDDPQLRQSFEKLLTEDGHQVKTASSGEAALAKIESAPPDILLLDHKLPGMTGLDLLRLLRGVGMLRTAIDLEFGEQPPSQPVLRKHPAHRLHRDDFDARQRGQQQGGAAGRGWTANFSQATARQASGKRIHRGDAARNHFWRRTHGQPRSWGNTGESCICRKSSLRRPPLGKKLRPGSLRAGFCGLFNIKNKRAALGRRSGNHCGRHKFLGKFQGTPGLEPRRRSA
jgi:hypothetical protein